MKNTPTFSEKMKYKLDNFMSRGGFSVFMALIVLFAVSFIVMALIRFILNLVIPDETVGELNNQLWRVFLQISDAGAVAEDGDSSIINKIVGIVTIMLGLVLFSSLVAFITSQFETKLEELRKGKSRVIEKNHTVILGFGDRVLEIIRELIIANESESGPAIVVLSNTEKDEMDDFFRERIENTKTTRIICRSGLTSSLQTLNKVSISQAKSVIILNDVTVDADPEEKILADARVLKTIIAVLAATGEENLPPLIAEIHQSSKRTLAMNISPNITIIEEHSVLAKLIVQSSLISGLALVYDNLVGFDGDEFYFYKPTKGWTGKTYGDLQFCFPTCSLMGYRGSDDKVVINPGPETVFKDSFEALLLAEDDSTINYTERSVSFNDSSAIPAGQTEKKKLNQLLVGWSEKSSIIVEEYTDYLLEGSIIDVLVHSADNEMKSSVDRLNSMYPEIEMTLIVENLHREGYMESLRPEKYDTVVILKGDGGEAEVRDSETISTLLEFRHYFRSLDKDITTQLISEVADSENVEVIQKIGVKDFLISNKFVSKIYSQVSEDPAVMDAYDELFQAEGSEIYLKPVSYYTSADNTRISFADLCAAAQKRNETCFGIRLASELKDGTDGFGININPPKNRMFNISRDDFLITLAEDEL